MQTSSVRRRGTAPGAILLAAAVTAGCTASDQGPRPPEIPTVATTSDRCRVSGPGSGPDPALEVTRLAVACERALPEVLRVWPEWSGSASIVVAESELAEGTAAYVEGLASPGRPAQGDRVVVAPGLTTELSADGLEVVLRHELTHLAMRSTGTAPLPLWATEGIAMHVGYASVTDARAERRPELERLQSRVQAGTWTWSVPDAALFEDPGSRAEAYTAAWLGIEALVEQHGIGRLVEAMRLQPRPADPGPPRPLTTPPITDEDRTAHFLGLLGVSERSLAEQWEAALERRTS